MIGQDMHVGLKITLASPSQIRSWSGGEVREPTTINYLTWKPEPQGLFSQQIFGPVDSWTCACGKYRQRREQGLRCDKCGVELADRSVRRERMGHIELAAPVAHPLFARRAPSVLAQLLDLSPKNVSSILSYASYLVLHIDERERVHLLGTQLDKGHETEILNSMCVGDVLDSATFATLRLLYGSAFRAQTGADALRERLTALDLDALASCLRKQIEEGILPRKKASKRLQVVEALRVSGVKPAWMILEVLPVLPPELRPLLPMRSGQFISSDLNAGYERILHRNNRIKQLQEAQAPEVILNNERRLLQEACDALFDNGHRSRPVLGSNAQPLKSLTDMISGKQGRFRKNLLGKRVDYSGRSVIVGDPTLQLHQCGLPTSICLELFKPFVIRKLLERHVTRTPRAAKRMVERPRLRPMLMWDLLEEVMFEKVVLLNRAPTLHRLSIQAFEARRVEGNAIRLHPLVCSAFNADFDGDQMAVHLPLSDQAQREARELMLSIRNLRSAATGEPTISISQEMVLGLFYLTETRPSTKSAGRMLSSATEARLALEHGVLYLHTPIVVQIDQLTVISAPGAQREARPTNRRIETTTGRLIFNEVLPHELGYRNHAMTKDAIKQLIAECLDRLGPQRTANVADELKRLGFTYATRSGLSFALSDIEVPPEKQTLLAEADAEASAIEEQYREGMITADERYRQLIVHWSSATDSISKRLEACLNPYGSLATIIKSGATKAKFQQIRQLSGIRGLMARPSGEIIEIPIRGNYLEGLNTREAFIASSAARNGFMGRSLNTSTTGYLTRKLVETGMEVWITEADCGTTGGFLITHEESQSAGLSTMHSRLIGRCLSEPIADLAAGQLIDERMADYLLSCGFTAVRVRSVLMCEAASGVCQRCYGSDLSTGKLVRLGTAVGVIAGQSIGEPGTQLSMKAFHSGGIANAQGDIRQGLPRVIELFEARSPIPSAPQATLSGTVMLIPGRTGGQIRVNVVPSDDQAPWTCELCVGQKPLFQAGQWIEVGTPVCNGPLDPHEILQVLGREATARYIINEVQRVFRATGVVIHDKHLECIVRQMLRYALVQTAADTTLVPGERVDRFYFHSCNRHVLAQGGHPAIATPLLLGITRAALQTSSWMAAASFQETTRVLVDAALRGQEDHLIGIKERVMAGLALPEAGRIQPHARRSVKPYRDSSRDERLSL
jgi:DNA-directed RNA polymerase subunit beta'